MGMRASARNVPGSEMQISATKKINNSLKGTGELENERNVCSSFCWKEGAGLDVPGLDGIYRNSHLPPPPLANYPNCSFQGCFVSMKVLKYILP